MIALNSEPIMGNLIQDTKTFDSGANQQNLLEHAFCGFVGMVPCFKCGKTLPYGHLCDNELTNRAVSQNNPFGLQSPTPVEQKPYKCPCCDGYGKRPRLGYVTTAVTESDMCTSCNGLGVLWR